MRETDRERERERQTDRQRVREIDRERESERDRQRERESERERQRQRDRENIDKKTDRQNRDHTKTVVRKKKYFSILVLPASSQHSKPCYVTGTKSRSIGLKKKTAPLHSTVISSHPTAVLH